MPASATWTTVAVTRGPGLIGALLVGLSSAKALAAARGLPLVPVDHLHGHVVASTLGADPIESPYLCLVASGGHTFLARVDEPVRVHGARPDARRRRRRGVRQGRAPARARLPGRARDRPPGARRRPRPPTTSRAARPGELDFSFSGLKTALLYRLRDRAGRAARRPRGLLPARDRRRARRPTRAALEREGLERLAIGGGVAANSELRAAVSALGVPVWVPPRRALHRQRGDDRRRGPLPRAAALPGLPGAGRRGPARLRAGAQAWSRDSSRSRSRSTLRRTSSRSRRALRIREQRLALGVVELVHQPAVLRPCAPRTPRRRRRPPGRRSAGAGSRTCRGCARPCRRAPSPALHLVEPRERRLGEPDRAATSSRSASPSS